MYLRARELLTQEQRKALTIISENMSDLEISQYYSFSNEDIKIINQHRRDYNKLGFAIQLCMLRYPGWSLTSNTKVPYNILTYVAAQIRVSPQEFTKYFNRVPTKHKHLEEIKNLYGYTNFNEPTNLWLIKRIKEYALETSNSHHLIKMTMNELRNEKVILPSIITIEGVVWEARKQAEEHIFNFIHNNLSCEQKENLDTMITGTENNALTTLSWLKENPGRPSAETFKQIINRLEYIRSLKLNIDMTEIHQNRLIQLARLGSRYEPHSFRRFEEEKRYAILVIYLLELSQDLVDQAIEIHDRQMNSLFLKGKKQQEEIQKKNGKSINEKIVQFIDLGAALLNAKKEGLDPFKALESIMSWDDIEDSIAEAKTLARPIDYDYYDLLDKRYNYMRKYTPTLLKSLFFKATESYKPVLKALDTIKEMNETKKRQVPNDATMEFIPQRWKKQVYNSNSGTVNRHYYEMAALSELRNGIRSGDISVIGSRQHKDFNDYLVSKEKWNTDKIYGTRLAVSLSVDDYLKERIQSLNDRISFIRKNSHSLEGVNLDKGIIQLSRLEKDTPDEAKKFSLNLYKLLPRIKLTDLLIEVANWTNFDEQFIHASSGHKPKKEEKRIVMASLIAMGTNIGFAKMADATPEISYHQLANTAQWRMYDDALNKAQAKLVNFHHTLPLSSYWGDGSTSSSDGMRVQIGASSLHADYNPHYGNGKGATMYRFISDQYSSFHTKVINTNARDAIHVIDGLLNHETDLNIEEKTIITKNVDKCV